MTAERFNQRRAPRVRGSDALTWRLRGAPRFEMGWTLERSIDGLAFVWRGGDIPRPGAIIEFAPGEGPGLHESSCAVVRHATRCHDDLRILGVEFLRLRPFPPQAAAIIEPHPRAAAADRLLADASGPITVSLTA